MTFHIDFVPHSPVLPILIRLEPTSLPQFRSTIVFDNRSGMAAEDKTQRWLKCQFHSQHLISCKSLLPGYPARPNLWVGQLGLWQRRWRRSGSYQRTLHHAATWPQSFAAQTTYRSAQTGKFGKTVNTEVSCGKLLIFSDSFDSLMEITCSKTASPCHSRFSSQN